MASFNDLPLLPKDEVKNKCIIFINMEGLWGGGGGGESIEEISEIPKEIGSMFIIKKSTDR